MDINMASGSGTNQEPRTSSVRPLMVTWAVHINTDKALVRPQTQTVHQQQRRPVLTKVFGAAQDAHISMVAALPTDMSVGSGHNIGHEYHPLVVKRQHSSQT